MKKTTFAMVLILVFSVIMMFGITGCSTEFNQTTASSTPDHETITTQPAESPLPVWTDEQIETLIPGFEVLKVDERAYHAVLDDQTSRFIRRTIGGTVENNNSGVQIGAWQLWEDRTVTVSTPNPGYAIVDFYPHPYRFNGHVKIWIDLRYVQLPPGMQWWQIQMFYLDDNGQLVPYWGYVDENARQYIAWTDHFSRYIIGRRVNN